MPTKLVTLILTVSLLGASACTNGGADEEVGGLCGALRSGNARGFQGASLQGASLQGMKWQGVQLQGMHLNARYRNGASYNAPVYNAPSTNGRAYNANFRNGTKEQGPTLGNGIMLQGQTLQGINIEGMELDHTLLRVTDGDGTVREGKELVGGALLATTELDELFPLVVANVVRDPEADGLTLYEIELPNGVNICGEGGQGTFVPGIWDYEDGSRSDTMAVGELTFAATFSCVTGVIAKCARWGFEPTEVGATLHQTCVRMARADYCGNGMPWTENGTLIDLYDVDGIQVPETPLSEMPFEAGWGPDGAVCVNHPRYQTVDRNGDEVLPSCWDTLPRCDNFDDAIQEGALMGNQSHIDLRRVTCGAI